MPALRVFGRRWGVASDDLVFPEITEAALKFVWWIAVLFIYIFSQRKHPCAGSAANLHTFIIVVLVANALDIIFAIWVAVVSARGTIRNPVPRRILPYIIYLRVPLLVFEFVWCIVGTSWAFAEGSTCEDELVVVAKVTCILGWILFAGICVGIFIIFDPVGGVNIQDHEVNLNRHAQKVWKRRFRLLFCCAGRDDSAKSAFEDVARLLAEFFHDGDWTVTDLWAGLLLLANRECQALNPLIPPVPNVHPPESWMNLKLADRYMDYALGVYGWPYYLCDNFNPNGCLNLLHGIRCFYNCQCGHVIIIKDNCCLCNTAALRIQTKIKENDLFYINFHNEIYETPFIAVVDHVTSSIVVAIRGSMSLKDAMTDLCAMHDECFDTESGVKVHKGIANSARYVLQKLESEKVLEDLFVLHPDYNLVITGHSLGAGVASVLTLMLKQKYPEARCYAFSPPGCTISKEGIEWSQKHIFTLVVGKDLIPRLSWQTIAKLKRNLLDAIDHCDRPKYDILVRGCYKLLCGPNLRLDVEAEGAEDFVSEDSSGHIIENAPNEPLLKRAQRPSYTDEIEPVQAEGSIASHQLFLPGRIAIIKDLRNSNFQVKWVDYGEFDRLELDARMIYDHMPYNVRKTLRMVAGQQIEF